MKEVSLVYSLPIFVMKLMPKGKRPHSSSRANSSRTPSLLKCIKHKAYTNICNSKGLNMNNILNGTKQSIQNITNSCDDKFANPQTILGLHFKTEISNFDKPPLFFLPCLLPLLPYSTILFKKLYTTSLNDLTLS